MRLWVRAKPRAKGRGGGRLTQGREPGAIAASLWLPDEALWGQLSLKSLRGDETETPFLCVFFHEKPEKNNRHCQARVLEQH